ncbi:MAG: hypothetical protein ACXWZR_17375 [Mycobacterium sp.]
MSTIRELKHNISDLIFAGSPTTTVSELAALAILDNHTLAVVPYADRDRDLLEQIIAKQSLGAKEVRTTRSVITITI